MTEQYKGLEQIQIRFFGALSVVYRTEAGSWHEVEPEEWGETTHSRRLLSLLIFHERRASRGTLMDQLWPDSESSFLDAYLTQAVSRLRTVLRDETLLQLKNKRTMYQLADQSLIWTDIDAFAAALQQAG